MAGRNNRLEQLLGVYPSRGRRFPKARDLFERDLIGRRMLREPQDPIAVAFHFDPVEFETRDGTGLEFEWLVGDWPRPCPTPMLRSRN
jgi:hypothetical protein